MTASLVQQCAAVSAWDACRVQYTCSDWCDEVANITAEAHRIKSTSPMLRSSSAISSFEQTCHTCGAGQYQSAAGQPSCHRCRKGKYRNFGNASLTEDLACTRCAAARFQAEDGQLSCFGCPAGKRGTGGVGLADETLACTECDPGTYQSATGQQSCLPCAAGKFRIWGVPASVSEEAACSPCARQFEKEVGKKGDARRVVKASIAMMLTPLSQNLACSACHRYVLVTLARHLYTMSRWSRTAAAWRTSVECSGTFSNATGQRRVLVAKGKFQAEVGHRPATAVHLANISR